MRRCTFRAHRFSVKIAEMVQPAVDTDPIQRYLRAAERATERGVDTAWASDQSNDLEARDILETRYSEVETKFDGRSVDRPPFWGGFRIVPERIEFWSGRPGRLHERLLYTKTASGWHTGWLFP